MNFLFVHQNFPGQYLHLASWLALSGRHNVVFVSEPNENRLQGVRRVLYRPIRASAPGIHMAATDFEAAMIRSESVGRSCTELARTGYRPDIIIGHNGWGELLNLKDIWPRAILDGYFEFFYQVDGADVGFDPEFKLFEADKPRVRAKNAINLLGLQVCDRGHTPTLWQQSTYPGWARRKVRMVPEGVDLTQCRPNPDATLQLPGTDRVLDRHGPPLLTYVARNLEPYRGFHVVMRALPELLRRHPTLEVVIVGGEGVSYGLPPPTGTWRQHLMAEVGDGIDPGRVHFVGQLPYGDYLSLLQLSSVHLYLTYPFVASWSLREALATGCCIVASDTAPVREFVSSGGNGILVPFFNTSDIIERILELLADPERRAALSRGARDSARDFELNACIERFVSSFLPNEA